MVLYFNLISGLRALLAFLNQLVGNDLIDCDSSSKIQKLVVKAVSLAIARDGASGGVVRTVIVSILTVYIIASA